MVAVQLKKGQEEWGDGKEDAVTYYLRDIGATPLLTAAEEVELGKSIEASRLAAERLAETPLSAEEELRAREEIAQGDAARKKLTECNLRLVVSIARRYTDRGVPLGDLIAEGNFGLMRAVEKFDWRRGFRFSTYATWWIRQAVSRGANAQSRVIRLPAHVWELSGSVAKTAQKLLQELGREPTTEEVAAEMGLTAQQVRDVQRAALVPVSLEQRIGPEGENSFGEFLEDLQAEQPGEQVVRAGLRERVEGVLEALTERERYVIRQRYGLDEDRQRTLEEIGGDLGVTRERIRQIEKEALAKLRQGDRCAPLLTFLR